MSASKLLVLLTGVLLCTATAVAQFPPTSVFQLDGQTAQNPSWPMCTYVVKGSNPPTTVTAACDYWNLLNGSGTVGQFTGTASDHWLIRSFASAGQGGPAFTQGSKDIDNPNGGWHYSTNPTPDKDTIENAYVAAYAGGVQKDLMLIFGAERNSVNGDANIGIWFFQQDVHPDPNSNTFVGNHVNNDVFLVSAFTGGGVTPVISIYIWNTACTGAAQAYNSNDPPSSPDKVCAGKNIEYVTSRAALCASLDANGTATGVSSASACAVTNQIPITVPWPSPVKALSGGQLPAQTFFTGGIDLTDIFKNVLGVPTLPCFASFLMNTRTSQSITATLKDFLGGGFPLCSMTIAKACQCDTILNSGLPLPGTTVSSYEYQVSGSVTNDGFGDFSNVSVTDRGLTFNCGTVAAGATKLWGVGAGAGGCTPANTNPACVTVANGNCFTSTSKPEVNSASVTAQSPTGAAFTASTGNVSCPATASACNPQPLISPSKCCSVTVTSQAKVQVNFDGRVTNGGTVALTSLGVQDDDNNDGSYDQTLTLTHFKLDTNGNPVNLGTCTSCTLLPNEYVTFTGNYLPNAADLTTLPGSATFRDRLKVTATRPDTGATLTDTSVTATCYLTLGQACPAP